MTSLISILVLKIQIGGFAHDIRRKLLHHQVLFKIVFMFSICATKV